MSKYMYHAVFLLAISFLIFKNFNQIKVENEDRFVLERVISLAGLVQPFFIKEQKMMVGILKKAALDFPETSNGQFAQQAIGLLAFSDDFNRFFNQNTQNRTEIAEKMTILKDSLSNIIRNDFRGEEMKGPILKLKKEEMVRFLSKCNQSDIGFFNALSTLESNLSVFDCLNYLRTKTSTSICGGWFYPLVLQNPLNPKVGQNAEIEVLITEYKTFLDRGSRFFIDGVPLQNVDGKAHFTKKFKKSGLQEMKVRGEWVVYSPFDEEVIATNLSFEKRYWVNVPESN